MFAGEPSVKWCRPPLHRKTTPNRTGRGQAMTLLRLVGDAVGGGRAEVTATIAVEVTAAARKQFGLRLVAVRRTYPPTGGRPLPRPAVCGRGRRPRAGHETVRRVDGRPAGPGRPVINAGGVYVCDFDRDGYLDVLVIDL